MIVKMCRAKIHRATVTETNLNYVGSITIDKHLLDASGIIPYEAVQVVNISNGERFETYAIEGPCGTGCICLNGAAARLACPGDTVIIMAFGWMDHDEAKAFSPRVVFVDEDNRVEEVAARENHGETGCPNRGGCR